jgi:hypothetical protein
MIMRVDPSKAFPGGHMNNVKSTVSTLDHLTIRHACSEGSALCGAREPQSPQAGEKVNCPTCRVIMKHVRDFHGYINIAPDLLDELKKAQEIIRVMLNLMSSDAKFQASKKLADSGTSPDGMTRNAERSAIIARAERLLK